jgi:hypothetical protein
MVAGPPLPPVVLVHGRPAIGSRHGEHSFALAGAGPLLDAPRNGMPHEHMRAAHMHSMLAIGPLRSSLDERQ